MSVASHTSDSLMDFTEDFTVLSDVPVNVGRLPGYDIGGRPTENP